MPSAATAHTQKRSPKSNTLKSSISSLSTTLLPYLNAAPVNNKSLNNSSVHLGWGAERSSPCSKTATPSMVSTGSSAAALAMVKQQSSSSSGSLSNSNGPSSTALQVAISASSHAHHHSSSSGLAPNSAMTHHHLPFHETLGHLSHHQSQANQHHRSSAHTAASLAASAFTPSVLAAAGAISSALTGSGGGGPNKSLKTEDIFGLSASSFGSLTSLAAAGGGGSGSGLKSGGSSSLLGGNNGGSNASSQMHSPISPVGSPYGSGSGAGGGGNSGGGGGNSNSERTFESMMNNNSGSNGGSNGTRKKQSTRDPLSHRMIEKRRRDRMNNCLTDLSRLIPNSFIKKSSSLQNRGRIEKTEIIEMAIKYMKHLQNLAEPLLVDDGPLGPSPTTTPIPSVEHDQLFMLCNSHSSNTGTALLKDRHQFMRYGYQECVNEVLHFLEENSLETYYIKLMEHLNEHRENLNIGVVNKYMLAGGTLGNSMSMINYEELQQLNAAHAAAAAAVASTSSGAPSNLSLSYQSSQSTMKSENISQSSEQAMSVDGMANGHGGNPLLGPPPPPQSSYSLNAIKYMIEGGSATSGSLIAPSEQHTLGASTNHHHAMEIEGEQSSHHRHHHHHHQSSPHSPKAPTASHHVENQPNSSGMMISSSRSASPTSGGNLIVNASADDGNKTGKSNAENAAGEPGHFNFKKDIKDRFQKVLDRMSDGSTSSSVSSRNSSSASSFNSDGLAEPGHSPPVTTGTSTSLSTSIVPTIVDTTAAVNQIVCQLSSSGSLSSNSSSSTLSASETKSVANDLQMISNSQGGEVPTTGNRPNAGESKPSTETIDIESMYQRLSNNLLNTLSSLITACTSEYSSGETGGNGSGQSNPTSGESVYVPIYAMHPSGHYYVPMHIEAAILGMKEEYTKSNKFPSKPPNTNSKLTNGETLGEEAAEQESVLHEQLEGRSPNKKMRYDREPTVLLSQSIKFAFNSKPPEFPSKVDSQVTMLYPMTITVNLSHHQNVSLMTVFSFLREMLSQQVTASLNGNSFGNITTTVNGILEELKRQGKSGRSDECVDLSRGQIATNKASNSFSSPLLLDTKSHLSFLQQQNQHLFSEHLHLQQQQQLSEQLKAQPESTMLAKHLLSGKSTTSPGSAQLTSQEIAQIVAANQEHLSALTNSVDLSSTVPPNASATAAQMMMMFAAAAHNLEKSGSSLTDLHQNNPHLQHLQQLQNAQHLESIGAFGGSSENNKRGSLIQSSSDHLSAFSAIEDSYGALKDRSKVLAELNPHAKTNGILKPIATTPAGHHHHHQQQHAQASSHPAYTSSEGSDVKPEIDRIMSSSSLYHKLTTPTGKGAPFQGENRNSHTPTLIIPNVPTTSTAGGSTSALPLTLPPGTSLHSLASAHSSVYNGSYGPFIGAASSDSRDQHSSSSALFSPPMTLNSNNAGQRSPGPPSSSPGHRGGSTSSSSASLTSYLQPHAALGQLNLSNYYTNLWASQLASGAASGGPFGGADFSSSSSSSTNASSSQNAHKGSPLHSLVSSNSNSGHLLSKGPQSTSATNPFGMLSLFGSGGGSTVSGPGAPSPLGSSDLAHGASGAQDPMNSSVAALRAHFDQYSLFGRGPASGVGGGPNGPSSMHHHHPSHQPIQSISLDQYGLNSSLAAAAAAAAANINKAAPGSSAKSVRSHSSSNESAGKHGPHHHQSERPNSALTPMNLTKETAASLTAKLL